MKHLFHEVTCGFKRLDTINDASNPRVRKTHLPTAASRSVPARIIRVLQFSVFSNLTFMHHGLPDNFSILSIQHNPLDHFVHASRTSGQFLNFVHSSRLVIISERDPNASFRVAQQWFRPKIQRACAMHPEFVHHLVNVFIPWRTFGPNELLSITVWNVSGNLFMKSTTADCSQNVCVREGNTGSRAVVCRTSRR